MSAVGFRRMITRLGQAAKMPFSVHPHMLRHACGFKLANDGHDHAGSTALPRSQEHPAHGSLHRASPLRFRDF
jgi:integrase